MKAKQENQDLRDYARSNGVTQWQIANHLGIHVMTLIGRLRKPFDEKSRASFMRVVDELAGDN